MDLNTVEEEAIAGISSTKSLHPGANLFRYPAGKIQVVTHRGKKTAQMFCQPRRVKNSSEKQGNISVNSELSSTYSTNMCEQVETFSIVSNLSELSEMSTLTNLDEDLITLKIKPNILPELHSVGNKTCDSNQISKCRKISNLTRQQSRELFRECRNKPQSKDKPEDKFDAEHLLKLKLSFDKQTEHILEDCNQKVRSLQHQVSRYNLDLTEMELKLSSSEQAERLARKELESVTQVRNWYQEKLRQIESSTENTVETEADIEEERRELRRLQMENIELNRRLTEEKICYETRLRELEDQISKDKTELEHLIADRDLAEGKVLSYENLIRDAQAGVLKLKEEKDAAYLKLDHDSFLIQDLKEKIESMLEVNATINQENIELKTVTRNLEDKSKFDKEKADQLEKMLDIKETEMSTLRSSLLKSESGKQELLEKFDNEKCELEMIIEELKIVKLNIEDGMIKTANKTTRKDHVKLVNSSQDTISISAADSTNQESEIKDSLLSKLEEETAALKGEVSKLEEALKVLELSKESMSEDFHKQRNENNDLKEKNKELEGQLAEFSTLMVEFQAREIKLNETIKGLHENIDNLTNSLEAKEGQIKDSEHFVNSLEEQKQKHETQLKGLHCALKTSFDHIKSLRKAMEESQHVGTLNLDDYSLDQLLSSTRNLQTSSLSSLKLSLFDLKENVRELNIELGSSAGTPNISSDRETPSFLDNLDKLQDISDSVGETPSLQLSSHSSLNSSPSHFIT